MELIGDPIVTDTDREMARAALVEGWNNCKATNNFGPVNCDCDHGKIDGCKARIEVLAKWIAAARKM